MTNLLLSPTRKHYRIGDKDDYVVLDGGRVIGRIMLHPHAPDGRSWFWTITAPDIPIARQAGLFSNTRRSDGGFQSAVAEACPLVMIVTANRFPISKDIQVKAVVGVTPCQIMCEA